MSNQKQDQPDPTLVAYIYANATAQVIAAQDGPSFEEILEQSTQAARVFSDRMAASHKDSENWLGSLGGMR